MNKNPSILVIDDEDSICLAFRKFFSKRGWTVDTAATAADGLEQYLENRHLVVFLDVRLPDRSGLDLLEDLKKQDAHVVVITAYGGLDTVVLAIQGKAYDYLPKPLDLDKALAVAERIRQSCLADTAKPGTQASGQSILLGNAPAMQEIYKLIARAASTDTPVLIEGETGTGKELTAKAIHQFSGRCNHPFVTVNCGAIPENLIESELFGHVRGAFTGAENDRTGRFESAHNGTLLLDEVGELPLPAQVKLLRVLDHGTIERVGSSRSIQLDVRIVAATNRNLMSEIERGKFRKDLFYRLAVLNIALPPLRSRTEDISLLASHFLHAKAGGSQIDSSALNILMKHNWPGNVRELKNAIEHAIAIAPDRPISADDLPQSVHFNQTPADSQHEKQLRTFMIDCLKRLENSTDGRYRGLITQVESALIDYALERFRGNQSEAANYLGVHRNTLRNKIRELNLSVSE